MPQWKEITTHQEWQAVLEKSCERPVLLFKHSTRCPISANAWSEFQSYLNGAPDENTEYIMVKVIESRDVSNQIAHDLNVVHQSPQIILIRNKKAVWDASHWNITQDAIRQAIH
ncbi:MAG: bacillithiol system redox-active protein YtxJ [Alicyclobacillaceae bacterium]|nr:bacillithiol system redox-active protein YtxJ [Alicyclobacillaceae bacterium]